MSDEVLKAELAKLIKDAGQARVCAALMMAGLSARQCELLAGGDHEGKFRRKTVTAVETVLAQRDTLKAS